MRLDALYADRYLPHARRTLKPATLAEYERLAAKVVLPKLGGRLIGKLTLEDAEKLHASTPGRVQPNRALALLSAILTYAVERRLIPFNPCTGAHRAQEKGREFFYTPEQSAALLRAAAAWDDPRARYITLVLLTGCRPNELRDACPTWRHGPVLVTPDGKTGTRQVFLSPAAEALLDAITPADPRERYFPGAMDLRRAWARLTREAGVPPARQYDMRHTFASAAIAAGTGLDVVGLMLGHRKRETTLRYAHLSPDIGVQAAAAAAVRMGA